MGNVISLQSFRGWVSGARPPSQDAAEMERGVTALASEITKICAGPRGITVLGWTLRMSLWSDQERSETARNERKELFQELSACAHKQDTLPTPARLDYLAARAYAGKIGNLDDLDRLVARIHAWDMAYEGLTASLLEGAGAALRDAIRAAKSGAVGNTAIKLTLREWDALEVVAAKKIGVPRVQQGEGCEQVLMDLDVRRGGAAENLLQDFAVFGPGLVRVAQGEDWRTVYQSLGVDPLLGYNQTLIDCAAICQGMARVSEGAPAWKTIVDICYLMRTRHNQMLHHPEKWETEYREETETRKNMLAAAADPERHYNALAESLFGK